MTAQPRAAIAEERSVSSTATRSDEERRKAAHPPACTRSKPILLARTRGHGSPAHRAERGARERLRSYGHHGKPARGKGRSAGSAERRDDPSCAIHYIRAPPAVASRRQL